MSSVRVFARVCACVRGRYRQRHMRRAAPTPKQASMVRDVESGEFLPSLFLAEQQRLHAPRSSSKRAAKQLPPHSAEEFLHILEFEVIVRTDAHRYTLC